MFKLSYYTFIIPVMEKGVYLAYNSFTNALLELEVYEGEKMLEWKKKGTISSSELDNEEKPFVTALLDSHFLIDEGVDEKEGLHHRISAQKERFWRGPTTIALTILPTVSCNMGCSYCFEGKKPSGKVMSDEVMDDVAKFVERELKHSTVVDSFEGMFVRWYGGEPLLQPQVIERLSRKLYRIADENELSFTSQIIMNGTYLTTDIWALLKEAKVSKLQVTIDGHRDSHNKQRPLMLPIVGQNIEEGSYDTILENLRSLPDGMALNIRINSDRTIINSLDNLLDDLEEIGLWPQQAARVNLTLAHKETPYEGSGAVDIESQYLSLKQQTKAQKLFQDMKLNHYNNWAVKNNRGMAKKRLVYPEPATFVCGAASLPYSFSISYDGHIHQCMEQVNDPQAKSHYIADTYDIHDPLRQTFLAWDKFLHHPMCTDCKVLPICDMVCPHKDPPEACCDWKVDLKSRLKEQYITSIDTPHLIESFDEVERQRQRDFTLVV